MHVVSLRFRLPAAAVLTAAALAAVLSQPGSAQAATKCANADTTLAALGASNFRTAIVCLTNEKRASLGTTPEARRPLVVSSLLTTAAQKHTDDMVARRYFSHFATQPGEGAPSSPAPNGRTFQDRLRKVGYCKPLPAACVSGENIYESYPSITPNQAMNSWMSSAVHRNNILSAQFREIGVGVQSKHAKSGATGGTVTQNFGTRQ